MWSANTDFEITGIREVVVAIQTLKHQFHCCNHYLFTASFINRFLKYSWVSH